MRTQVYLTLHDTQKCLLFRKNEFSRFWGRNTAKTGKVNGGGKFCFPGGEWEVGRKNDKGQPENMEEAALREFKEETGFMLPPGLLDIKCIGPVAAGPGWQYAGYAVKVKAETLEGIYKDIVEQLREANALHLARTAVVDNELENVWMVDITALNVLYFKSGDPATGWFYDLVARGLFL